MTKLILGEDDRNVGPGAPLQGGNHDGPGSYVFASTTGRAVSQRQKVELSCFFQCLRRRDTSTE
jgi:hypothetical protein